MMEEEKSIDELDNKWKAILIAHIKYPDILKQDYNFQFFGMPEIIKDILKDETRIISDYNEIKDEILELQSLSLSRMSIDDYSYLKHLKNLTSLDLSFGKIQDSDTDVLLNLDKLENLNLEGCNSITNFNFVCKLTNIKIINLSRLAIKDISFLENLNLTKLYLIDSFLMDTKTLSGFKELEELDLNGSCSIDDLSFLKKFVKLRKLNLHNVTAIAKDLNVLQNMVMMEELDLSMNFEIGDITAIAAMKNLRKLNLSLGGISNILPLQEMNELEELILSQNSISDITSLKGKTELRVLEIYFNDIYDLSPLESSRKLEILKAQREETSLNKIKNIDALRGMSNLKIVNLKNHNIENISALSDKYQLLELELSSNKIVDISALSNNENLKKLFLDNNEITDISGVGNLTKLQDLYLRSNSIEEINSLENLKKVGKLDLAKNNIKNYSVLFEMDNLSEVYLDKKAKTIGLKDKLPFIRVSRVV